MPKIRIVGAKELQAKIKVNGNMDAVKRIVQMNGAELQQKAMRGAPVDTGNLKRSIGLRLTDGGMTAEVEPTAEYAPYVEYGTRFMNAKPYMRPAYDAQKTRFKSDLERLMR